MLRRFGALGDLHAEDEHLAAALAHLRTLDCDAILSVGDIADGRGDLDRTVELLRAHDVIAVRGNHDRWLVSGTVRGVPNAQFSHEIEGRNLEWLEQLPPTWTAETPVGTLLLCHAVGDDDMIKLLPDDDAAALADNAPLQRVLASGFDVMVCGHTHKPMVRTLFGLVVINPGTLHYAYDPCFMHVDLVARTAQMFVLDGTRVLPAEVLRFGGPGDDVWGAGF